MKHLSSELLKFRKSAKRLKKAYDNLEPKALDRINAYLPKSKTLKHADFLFVVAKEQGHDSWPKLKFALETTGMSLAQKVKRLETALYLGQKWVIEKLLSLEPGLAKDRFSLQLALYDYVTVKETLAKNPELANVEILGRLPLHHLCFSHYIHMAPEKKSDMLNLADLLVRNGADVNSGMTPPEQNSNDTGHKLSPLYGALGHANNIDLATWLLEHGANPDDNESLYHATELGHHKGLKLLIKHGVRISGTNALARALDFNDYTAVELLLEHGANPNEICQDHPSDQPIDTVPALHQAARRRCSAQIAELLLKYDADATYIWQGHSPYALALIHGNFSFAKTLETMGHATLLSPGEEILVACARGELIPSSSLKLHNLPDGLQSEDYLLITKLIVEPDSLGHVKALVSIGLDISQVDMMGLPPLHSACWAGLPEQVRYLLSFEPDLEQLNDFGGNAIATTLHGSENCPERKHRNHIACVKLLLEAGAKLSSYTTGNEAMALFLESWLDKD